MVNQQRAMGNDVVWDGWDVVFHRAADHAMHSISGVWRDGKWNFANRVQVDSDGIWNIDPRNILKSKRYNRPRP
jgi:hypothetical protein